MLTLSLMAFFAHALVVTRAVRFFRCSGSVRDSDKHGVAAIALLSALFLVTQSLAWSLSTPWTQFYTDLSASMFQAYNFAVGVVFLGQLQITTAHRVDRC